MGKKIIIFPIIAIIIFLLLITKVVDLKAKNSLTSIKDKVFNNQDSNFNINLIKQVNKNRKDNYLISPYSIEIAISLLKEGANGNTLKEIEALIGTRTINDVTIKNRISVANAAFIKKDYKKYILNSYIENIRNKYDSELIYDEFKTPKVINDWVYDNTDGMIEKILDSIDDDFVLGLANAIAIDVNWDSPFDCISTTKEEFTTENGKKINVEMMHNTFNNEKYKYLENKNAKGIVLPYMSYDKNTGKETYEDNDLEFIGILPNGSLDKYIENLTNDEINDLLNSYKQPSDTLEIKLAIPRFKYDFELEDFKEVLKSMGMNDSFDENKADFTKIISKNSSTGNIYVGEAIHKTHVDFNEVGTKAAAVTYFGLMKATAAMPQEKEVINIRFNKPFIYIIRDKKTNEMLFFGVVYKPNEWHGSTCSEMDS